MRLVAWLCRMVGFFFFFFFFFFGWGEFFVFFLKSGQ